VVHTLKKDSDMQKNIRLKYVVDFIKSLGNDLGRRTKTMTNPGSVFRFVKIAMTTYAPPNVAPYAPPNVAPYAPPVLDIGTVAEEGEGEEETAHGENSLYLDIEAKIWKVRNELRESARMRSTSTGILAGGRQILYARPKGRHCGDT
jgi:hypothetical protein